MGGLKTSPYAAFCLRGINDTASVTLIKTLYVHKDRFAAMWDSFKKNPIRLGKVNWEQMFKEPCSLSLFLHPSDADTVVRSLVRSTHLLKTVHKKLSSLLSFEAKNTEKSLIETLETMKPMSIKLCSALYELSSIAIREKILGQFHIFSSVLRLGVLESAYNQELRP